MILKGISVLLIHQFIFGQNLLQLLHVNIVVITVISSSLKHKYFIQHFVILSKNKITQYYYYVAPTLRSCGSIRDAPPSSPKHRKTTNITAVIPIRHRNVLRNWLRLQGLSIFLIICFIFDQRQCERKKGTTKFDRSIAYCGVHHHWATTVQFSVCLNKCEIVTPMCRLSSTLDNVQNKSVDKNGGVYRIQRTHTWWEAIVGGARGPPLIRRIVVINHDLFSGHHWSGRVLTGDVPSGQVDYIYVSKMSNSIT